LAVLAAEEAAVAARERSPASLPSRSATASAPRWAISPSDSAPAAARCGCRCRPQRVEVGLGSGGARRDVLPEERVGPRAVVPNGQPEHRGVRRRLAGELERHRPLWLTGDDELGHRRPEPAL
jgi:hypothetical protein